MPRKKDKFIEELRKLPPAKPHDELFVGTLPQVVFAAEDDLDKRKGRITYYMATPHAEHLKLLLDVFVGFIPYHSEIYMDRRVIYGFHPYFDVVPEGEVPPEYTVRVSLRNTTKIVTMQKVRP